MFHTTLPSCVLPGQVQASEIGRARIARNSLLRRCSIREATTEGAESSTAPRVCKTCGIRLEAAPRGCDNQGRIGGGLGAVVGFDWWPIKAYRPCPAASKAGVAYNRKGQITDEMLFGRGTGGKNK